jgi:hypothetical protein
MAEHVKRAKGETQGQYNERAARIHKQDAIDKKKEEGRWLPKEEYEKLTGKPGKKD